MSQSLKILIVDDDRRMTHTLADILTLAGHIPTQAASGQEALELTAHASFDCVFCDIMMPGMNGVEFYQALRQERPDLPVVLITAYAHDELIQRGLQMGVAGVLEKPLDIDLLLHFCYSLKNSRSIAIVDGDPEFCNTLSALLRLRNYTVTIITDPHQAIDSLSDDIQIALIDMKLNVINGYDGLKEIRRRFPHLPVLLITGYGEEMATAIQQALEINASACLYKPLEIQKLLQILGDIQTPKLRQALSGKTLIQ
jgi:CheY-like chemotaxis protein